MSPDSARYEAILARRSVRQYSAKPLDAATQAQVDEIAAQARPLIAANAFQVLRRDGAVSNALFAMLGAYGRLINPPHALIPYIVGGQHALTDLGYRAEQIVVRLGQIGVATCYIGALKAEQALNAAFELPPNARAGAMLIYGRPATGAVRRAVEALIRSAARAEQRLSLEQLYFQGDFDHPARPAKPLLPLLEAARQAPSAYNAQPWRFLGRDDALYLYVAPGSPKYLAHGPSYELYDCGICMGNIALAMAALGIAGAWRMVEDPAEAPPCPPTLRPLAQLTLS